MADKLTRTLVVMSFFFGMALFSSCGANSTEITDNDNGQNFTVQAGDVITLTLVSNPTTGYSWQVMEIDQTILLQRGDPEYNQSPGTEGLVGAGGVETFHFEAIGTGDTILTLGYARPWESVPPIEEFSIQVTAQ